MIWGMVDVALTSESIPLLTPPRLALPRLIFLGYYFGLILLFLAETCFFQKLPKKESHLEGFWLCLVNI